MWYKAEYYSGPGHQSSETVYFWCTENLERNDDLRDDYWTFYIPEWAKYHHTVGCLECVKGLPKEVLEEKIDHYKNRIEAAQRMLSILENTVVE